MDKAALAPGASLLDMFAAKAASPAVKSEMERILSVPISDAVTPEEVEGFNRLMVLPGPYREGFRLTDLQVFALLSALRYGLMAPIDVGGGKTLISLLLNHFYFTDLGYQRTMLFVPAPVLRQLTTRDLPWARRKVRLDVNFLSMEGRSKIQRLQIADRTKRACLIAPYSLLSLPDTDELLARFSPEVLIFDEAHNIKNLKSARTRRILSYVESKQPRVVVMSGTLTNKSVHNYAHLAEMALGDLSPLPLRASLLAEWAAVLDANRDNWNFITGRRATVSPLRPLLRWSQKNFPLDTIEDNEEGFRRAYQNRLLSTPGIVSSPLSHDSVGASLLITNTMVPLKGEGASLLEEKIKAVEEEWVTPSGDEIEHAFHKFKCQSELTAGFYYKQVWPEVESLVRRGKSDTQAIKDLEVAREHHKLLQVYHRALREWIKYNASAGLDTPMLIGSEMKRNGAKTVGQDLYSKWAACKVLEFEGMPERESVPVRVCGYKIENALKWMKSQDPGLVWYYHQEVGRWLTEAATKAGIEHVHCPAGKQYDEILGTPDICKNKFAIASIKAHGVGKNLQFYSNQLCVELPRPEDTMQQMLGRTHRRGQEEDEVNVHTLISTEHDAISFSATLNDAVYVWETTYSMRKVLIASYDPMPDIKSTELLQRAGAEAKKLSPAARRKLEEKFSVE